MTNEIILDNTAARSSKRTVGFVARMDIARAIERPGTVLKRHRGTTGETAWIEAESSWQTRAVLAVLSKRGLLNAEWSDKQTGANDRKKRFGAKVDRHCPYDEAMLREDRENAGLDICPCCWTTFKRPSCDSDRNPEGQDASRLGAEHESAGLNEASPVTPCKEVNNGK